MSGKWQLPLIFFATRHNTHRTVFVAPESGETARLLDSLSTDWSELGLVDVLPPGTIIQLVWSRITNAARAKFILIDPWFPDLRQRGGKARKYCPYRPVTSEAEGPRISSWFIQGDPSAVESSYMVSIRGLRCSSQL